MPRGNRRNLAKAGAPGNKGRGSSQDRKDAAEVRRLSRKMVLDKTVQAMLLSKMKDGTAHPSIVSMLYAYAFGKPVEIIEQTTKTIPVKVEHVYAPDVTAPEETPPFASEGVH